MPDTDWVQMLKALADATRLRVVKTLLTRRRSVNEIVEALDISQYNVSKHLRVLREAGIVEVRAEGTRREYLIAEPFRRRLAKEGNTLDLGCCVFRFDRLDV